MPSALASPISSSVADLLVRLQRHDDVAVGPITLLFISDEVRDERRRREFVVGGAAAVVVAVFLGQFERVERPVGRKRLDHVEMSKQQDRLAGAGAAQSRHQIALARRRLEHLHVVARKAGGAQPCCHGVGGPPRIPCRRDRVDLDQFLIDVERELLLRRKRLRQRGSRRVKRKQCRRCDRPYQPECDTSIHDVLPNGHVLVIARALSTHLNR